MLRVFAHLLKDCNLQEMATEAKSILQTKYDKTSETVKSHVQQIILPPVFEEKPVKLCEF